MSRALRYLRIAFSATCLIACVLLIVLWVRSYWWADSVTNVGNDLILHRGGTEIGSFFFGWEDYKTTPKIPPPDITNGWEYQRYDSNPHSGSPAWMFTSNGDAGLVRCPAWFVTLCAMSFAIMPWLPWSKRFSLRTLLIATTLVAMVLGLVAWAMRSGN